MQVTLMPWPRRKADSRSFWSIHHGISGAVSTMPVILSDGKISVMLYRGVGPECSQRRHHLLHHDCAATLRIVAMVGDPAGAAGVSRVVQHDAAATGKCLGQERLGIHVDARLQRQQSGADHFGLPQQRFEAPGRLGSGGAV
jgi:hypothetical protein